MNVLIQNGVLKIKFVLFKLRNESVFKIDLFVMLPVLCVYYASLRGLLAVSVQEILTSRSFVPYALLSLSFDHTSCAVTITKAEYDGASIGSETS